MDYALIKTGTVQNVIVADEQFIAQIAAEWDRIERIDTPAEQALGVGIGWGWDGTQFVAPPAPPAPPPPEPPEWEWYIDIGPFFDRFGAAKMAVLTSTDPGVRALLADIQIRKWIDLQNPSVAQGVAYIGSVIPAVDAAAQAAILTTPVLLADNLALRKLYFGG